MPIRTLARATHALASVVVDVAKIRRSLVLALRSLWLHKLRSLLSVLGIIIGTFSVIALMAFGEGSMQDALDDIRRQGATNIIVRSVKPPDDSATSRHTWIADYGLTYTDFACFGTIQEVVQMVPMRVFPQQIRRLGKVINGRLVATTQEYANVHELTLSCGRFLNRKDDLSMDNVCVLGAGIADRLFPYDNPENNTVQLGKYFYRIIGVLKERMPTGGTGGSQAAEVFDLDVYIPLRTCRVRYGDKIFIRTTGSRSGEKVELSQVTLTVSDIDKVRPTGDAIRTMLEERHVDKDWAVTVPLDRLEQAEREKDRFTRLLVLIASISLLVGGIGIMNIMLATVTERTREIGIRRALGAKQRDITLQFLVEAVVQTSVGGLVGVSMALLLVLGLPPIWDWLNGTVAHLAAMLPGDWGAELALPAKPPVKLHKWSIPISLFVSIGVGVLFGWYPARRAARLDPIEALRHE